MTKTLHDAAVEDDTTLLQSLPPDQFILAKYTLNNDQGMNPLHIAAMLGNRKFVKEFLRVSPDMCFVGDRFGRIPLHQAIIHGRFPVVQELIHAMPLTARERTDGGGNVLHLCVKYNQLQALEWLLDTIEDKDFAKQKDDQGMTILHLAACEGQTKTIESLLKKKDKVDVNARNANGSTALDLFHGDIDPKMKKALKQAGARIGSHVEDACEWLSEKRDTLLIVASLVAAMAFQAGINPAGGVWEDNSDQSTSPPPNYSPPPSNYSPPPSNHSAGEAVMGYQHPNYYRHFIRANTVAFVSSLSTILLLISGLPFRNKFFLWFLIVIMWLTITAIALTYAISIVIVTPEDDLENLSQVINIAVTVWCCVISLLLLGNTIRLINRWIIRHYGFDVLDWLRRLWSSAVEGHSDGKQGSDLKGQSHGKQGSDLEGQSHGKQGSD